MSFLCLLPVILSSLLLAAHFLRTQDLVFVTLSLALLPLLLLRRRWVATLAQVFLLFGAFEWLRTLITFIQARQAMGLPWTRLLFILGGVFLFTALAPLLFETPSLRRRYTPPSPKQSTDNPSVALP